MDLIANIFLTLLFVPKSGCTKTVKISRKTNRDFIYHLPCKEISGMDMERKTEYEACGCPPYTPFIMMTNRKPTCVNEEDLSKLTGCISDISNGTTPISPSRRCKRIERVTRVTVLDFDPERKIMIWNHKKNRTLLQSIKLVHGNLEFTRPENFNGLMAQIWMKCSNSTLFTCRAVRRQGTTDYPLQEERPIATTRKIYKTSPPQSTLSLYSTVATAKKSFENTKHVTMTTTKHQRWPPQKNSDDTSDSVVPVIVGSVAAIIVITLLIIFIITIRKRKMQKRRLNEGIHKPHYEVRPLSSVVIDDEIVYSTPEIHQNDSTAQCHDSTTFETGRSAVEETLPVTHRLLLKSNNEPFLKSCQEHRDENSKTFDSTDYAQVSSVKNEDVQPDGVDPDYAEASHFTKTAVFKENDYDSPENDTVTDSSDDVKYSTADAIGKKLDTFQRNYDTPENNDAISGNDDAHYSTADNIRRKQVPLIKDYDTPENGDVEYSESRNGDVEYSEPENIPKCRAPLLHDYDIPENDDVNYSKETAEGKIPLLNDYDTPENNVNQNDDVKITAIISDDPDYYSTAISPRDSMLDRIKSLYAQVNKSNV